MTKLKSLIENQSPRHIFLSLTLIYMLIYVSHIPSYTSNADVLIYSLKAVSEKPILQNAYLDNRSHILVMEEPLPNIHIMHTTLLWLIYKIFPSSIAASIYPAGFLSAIFGALAIGLSFVVCMQLKFDIKVALITSIIAGFIPCIFYHSIIGEVFSLGLFSILCFLYFFQKNRDVASAVAFCITNLISPTFAPSFAFFYLKQLDWLTTKRTIFIGSAAVILFLAIHNYVGNDIFQIFYGNRDYLPKPYYSVRSAIIYVSTLVFYLLLNFNVLILYIVQGLREMWHVNRRLIYGILIIFASHVIVTFPNNTFTSEYGAYFVSLFWVLCIPIGVAISRKEKPFIHVLMSLTVLYFVAQTVVIQPNRILGENRHRAGIQLRSMMEDDVRLVGEWTTSIGVQVGRLGWDLEKLASNYVECPFPRDIDLEKIGDERLLIIEPKTEKWKRALTDKYNLIKFRSVERNYTFYTMTGKATKLYENDEIIIKKWKKYE